MTSTFALTVALLTTALPLAAAAQAPSSTTGDLQLEHKQKRSIVLPKLGPDQVRTDADRAVSEYAAAQRVDRLVRETSPVRPSARPDLDHDVRSGFQSRGISDALRSR